MKIKVDIFQVWYKIAFNGRNILELYGADEDIKQLCEHFAHGTKEANFKIPEKLKRICVIRDSFTGDETPSKQLERLFNDERIFDKFDVFIIENAREIATDDVSQISKNHPDHYWLLCRYNMPYNICSDNICRLEADENKSHFWNVFVPYQPTLYNDFKFEFNGENYRINMQSHNAILIRGNTCTGKTMMCDTLKKLTSHVQTWLECNGDLKGFLVGNDESRFAAVCVLGLWDLYYLNNLFTIDSVFDKYKVFVIDHADILVNHEIEKVIVGHPDHKWVLIGNYKPDFIPEDAVCVWKNEGHRYWNEFVSELN